MLLFVDRNIKYEIIVLNTCERNWWTITIKISDKNYKGTLMLVYHSPSSSDAEFMDFLEETCCNEVLNGSIIIMGDFNIDMKVKNYCQSKLMRIMFSVGLKQLVNEPTRIVNTSETIIDLIFTNEEVEVAVKHEPKITDHSIVVLQWNVSAKKKENRTIVCRDYRNIDVEKYIKMIDKNLNSIEGGSVSALANLTISVIVECLDEVAPRKRVILRDRWQGKQWFSEAIRQMVKQRDETYKLARTSKSENDWELFRQLKNKVVDECRKAKRNYLELRLDKNRNDPKRM